MSEGASISCFSFNKKVTRLIGSNLLTQSKGCFIQSCHTDLENCFFFTFCLLKLRFVEYISCNFLFCYK